MQHNTHEIGIKLQSLLRIPPINKCDNVSDGNSKAQQGSVSLEQRDSYESKTNTSEDSHTIGAMIDDALRCQKTQTSNSISELENWRTSDSNTISQEPDACTSSRTANNTARMVITDLDKEWVTQNTSALIKDVHKNYDATVLRKHHEATPLNCFNDKIREFPELKRNTHQSNNESTQQFTRSRCKITSTINHLIDNEQSPKNMAFIREKLIEAALQEHKPGYHLDLDKAVLEVFKLHGIEPLTKKSIKFVRAKYFCKICNYHMDNISNVITHVSNSRHTSNAKLKSLEKDVESIPNPSENHERKLHSVILEIMNNHGIGEAEKKLRFGVLAKLNEVLAAHKIQLELFGSSVPGFGFMDSNINFNLDLSILQCEETKEPMTNSDYAVVITDLSKILEGVPFVRDVTEGQHALQIKFTDTTVNRMCSIQVNNTSGILTAKLFCEYDRIDPRVRPLVVAFRYWARVASVDDQDIGLLPGHAFTILVLKYLIDVGVIPYIMNTDDTPSFRSFLQTSEKCPSTWKSTNTDNLGSLWLGLFRKYSLEFPMKDQVVSIVQPILLKSTDRIWNKKLSIEDPIIPRSNLCRHVSSNKVCDYICERIKFAYLYFGIPRIKGGIPLYEKIIPLQAAKNPEKIYFYETMNKPKPIAVVVPVQTRSNQSEQLKRMLELMQGKRILTDENESTSIPMIRMINRPDYNGDNKVHVIQEDIGLLHQILSLSEYHYEFEQNIFQAGEEPPKHCKSCGQDGHTRRDCPDEIVPLLMPVSYPDIRTLGVLENVMYKIYAEKSLSEAHVAERNIILGDIFRSLVGTYPDVELMLFGSTNNGFGLRGSDVDVCLRFRTHPICKADFRSDEVGKRLKVIADKLKSSGCMQEVLAIPSAKVPIVKFKHKKTRLEGDISLSNELALRNTRLLRTYTEIDPRVKVLGCFLKQLTKLCDISDASKGSISSYGYVLMLIHFLQQISPPVLPVLQQIPNENRPQYIVDGWDSYFFRETDAKMLSLYWNGFRSNSASVAELFLGFIRFYTEYFNFEERVVTINQLEPLTRKHKRWMTSTLICIEDPFERCHNLGAGLTKRMSVYIIKTFQKYREVFSQSIWNYSPHVDYAKMFLDLRAIRGPMNPPIDRQCRNCNRIGHFAHSCTYGNRNGDLSPEVAEDDSPTQQSETSFRQEDTESGEKIVNMQMDVRQLNKRNSAEREFIPPANLDIRFFEPESDSLTPSDGLLQDMIERNPGVIFQLKDSDEQVPQERRRNSSSLGEPEVQSIHQISFLTPPGFPANHHGNQFTGNRHGNPIYPLWSYPPPGFVPNIQDSRVYHSHFPPEGFVPQVPPPRRPSSPGCYYFR